MAGFFAVLKKNGLNSVNDLREIWLLSLRGDDEARSAVFRVARDSLDGRKLIDKWANERTQHRAKLGVARDLNSQPRKGVSQWELMRDKAAKSKWTPIYEGGLPSLGKRSK